jgi:hypothetical protein
MYRNAILMNRLCNAPPVPSHYIVSSAKDTIRQLQWKKERGDDGLDLGDMPDKTEFEPGDGTVAAKPMRTLFEVCSLAFYIDSLFCVYFASMYVSSVLAETRSFGVLARCS